MYACRPSPSDLTDLELFCKDKNLLAGFTLQMWKVGRVQPNRFIVRITEKYVSAKYCFRKAE